MANLAKFVVDDELVAALQGAIDRLERTSRFGLHPAGLVRRGDRFEPHHSRVTESVTKSEMIEGATQRRALLEEAGIAQMRRPATEKGMR